MKYYKWVALISFLGGKKVRTRWREKRKEKKFVRLPGRVLTSRPRFLLTHRSAMRVCVQSVMHYCVAESGQQLKRDFKRFK